MNFQMNKLFKQAQEMQKKMQQAQEELAKMEVCGEAGGGMVKVYMNGQHRVLRILLAPEIREETLEVLSDLIVAAINDANSRVAEASKQKLSVLTAGIELPGGLGSSSDSD